MCRMRILYFLAVGFLSQVSNPALLLIDLCRQLLEISNYKFEHQTMGDTLKCLCIKGICGLLRKRWYTNKT